MKFRSLTFALVPLVISTYALGASFDCKKARTYAETQVCSNPLLSKLDDAMAFNYRNMTTADLGPGGGATIRQVQKKWLSERDRCSTVACLEQLYRSRITETCDYAVVAGVHPDCIDADDIH